MRAPPLAGTYLRCGNLQSDPPADFKAAAGDKVMAGRKMVSEPQFLTGTGIVAMREALVLGVRYYTKLQQARTSNDYRTRTTPLYIPACTGNRAGRHSCGSIAHR